MTLFFRLIDFIYMLLLCHENDVRLTMDNTFQSKIASLYLPLVGIIVNNKECLFDSLNDNSEYSLVDFGYTKRYDLILFI